MRGCIYRAQALSARKHPQDRVAPDVKLVFRTVIVFPQSHTHFQRVCLAGVDPSRERTRRRPNRDPVMSITLLIVIPQPLAS